MKIIPNQKFKHETETYEKGREYEVDDDLGEYFQSVGWVGDGVAGGDAVTLDIHDSQMGHESEVN